MKNMKSFLNEFFIINFSDTIISTALKILTCFGLCLKYPNNNLGKLQIVIFYLIYKAKSF